MEKVSFFNKINKKTVAYAIFIFLIVTSSFSFTDFINTRKSNYFIQSFIEKLNLRVDEIRVLGRKNTQLEDIISAINVNTGDQILTLDLPSLRESLIGLPWVLNAKIFIGLPNKLNIKVIEHNPGAIWVKDNRLHLINVNGEVLKNIDPDYFPDLPIVIGSGAAKNLIELQKVLLSAPNIKKHVTAASYISNKRWNLHLEGKMIAKLPSENPFIAIKKLEKIDALNNLLLLDIEVIDLRLNDRMILKLGSRNNQENALGEDT
tara:strand:+ start:274 stop:1059 length:786 start_codon:yes stop_codon:yes gene_type:complete